MSFSYSYPIVAGGRSTTMAFILSISALAGCGSAQTSRTPFRSESAGGDMPADAAPTTPDQGSVTNPPTQPTAGGSDAATSCLMQPAEAPAQELSCVLATLRLDTLFEDLNVLQALAARIDGATDEDAPHAFDGAPARAAERLDPAGLQQQFEAELARRLADTDLAPVREFLSTPLGQRYAAIGEDKDRRTAAPATPNAATAALQGNILDAGRYREVLEIVTVRANRLWGEAVALSKDTPLDEERFARGLAAVMPELTKAAEGDLLAQLEGWSDGDLAEVLTHERSAPAQAWIDAFLKSLDATYA